MLVASVTVQVGVQDSVCHCWHIRLPQHVIPQQAMYLLACLLRKRRKITFPTELSCSRYRFMLEHKLSEFQTCPLENLFSKMFRSGGSIVWKQSPVIDWNCPLWNKKMKIGLNQVEDSTRRMSFNFKTTSTSTESKEVVSYFSCFIRHQSCRCMWRSRNNALLRECTFRNYWKQSLRKFTCLK